MPIIKDFKLDFSTRVLIWEITEIESELKSGITFSDELSKKFESINLKYKRKEFLSKIRILKILNYDYEFLSFKKSGKPFLNNNKKISISNSYGMVMIGISNIDLGVDIEKARGKITRIKHKFINKSEKFISNKNNEILMLTKLWTAKEAIFKSYGMSGLSFSKQINVLPFKSDEISGKAFVIDNGVIKHFSLIFVNLRGYYATIALPK